MLSLTHRLLAVWETTTRSIKSVSEKTRLLLCFFLHIYRITVKTANVLLHSYLNHVSSFNEASGRNIHVFQPESD